jgi:hypothetical protein
VAGSVARVESASWRGLQERDSGGQLAGWALWPWLYGPVGYQEGSIRPCSNVHSLSALACCPLLDAHIYLAYSDT